MNEPGVRDGPTPVIPLTDDLVRDLFDRAKVLGLLEAPEDSWLSPEQAAGYLGCRKGRIYNHRSAGRLPRDMEGGRAVNRKSDLDALVRDRAK